MLINQNTNTFMPVVTAIANDSNSYVTADGVYLNKTYSFAYEIQHQSKKLKYKATGNAMLQSFDKWANIFSADFGTTDLAEIRRLISSYVTAYATRYISKSAYAKHRKQYKKCFADAVLVTKKAIAGDSQYKAFVNEMIEAYMYIKHINADVDMDSTTLHVTDFQRTKQEIQQMLADFHNQPMVQQGAVKTKAEMQQMLELGGLRTYWS